MTESRFTIALRLEVRLVRGVPAPLEVLQTLPSIATRELQSQRFAADHRPAEAAADDAVAHTFAEQSLVNTSRDPLTPPVELLGETAYVVAAVVTLPDFAPVPPGGEYPDITDERVSREFLIHRASLRDDALWGEDEAAAGHRLLQTIVDRLPLGWWGPDA
ncbi:hypothetical protein [Conexibacter woesei]|uniref:hypothetical protein n=1 Tax=Conexibacter woesei TaxID=191495 RepID=UPI0005A24F7C|nr:hypothetical protein [Conexibacter woesei]